jgi:hypothetical protein
MNDKNDSTASTESPSTPLFGVGDSGIWADADKRNPGHLRIREMTVIEVFHNAGKYEIQSEGYPYMVPFSTCFKTISVRKNSLPNV